MIKVVCVGKIKEPFFKEAVEEYRKRISRYEKIEIKEVFESKYDEAILALEEEKKELLKNIGNKDYVITLEIEGKEYNSIEFSNTLQKIYTMHSTITFIIGGSHGIHKDIKERSNLALSFSKMTFPHQLFRVLLLEQIYRAFKIKNNESYHK